MPRYVVHIGPHKTGSTYLQSRFVQLRDYLAGRGITYPAMWNEGSEVSQFPLVRRLRAGDAGLAAELAALNRSPHEIVLISAEGLADLEPDEVGRFAELVGAHPVDIVFYCRRWSELLGSGWRELVKYGHTEPFPAAVAAALADPFASHVLNFHRRLDRVCRVFGRERVHLVSYNHLVERGIDLFTHFATRFLHLPDVPALPGVRINISFDPIDSEMFRVLHDFHQARGGRPDQRLTVEYLRRKQTLDCGRIVAAMQRDMRGLSIDEDAIGLRSLHHQLIGEFGDRVVEPRPAHLLFAPTRVELPFVGQRYLLADGVGEAIARLYRQLVDGLTEAPATAVLPLNYADTGSPRARSSISPSPTAMTPPVTTSA